MSDLLKFRDQIFERPSEKLNIQSEPEAFTGSHHEDLAQSPTPLKTEEPLSVSESPKLLETEACLSAEAPRPHLPPRASLPEFGYVPSPDVALLSDEIPRDFSAILEDASNPTSTPNKQEIEDPVW